MEDIMYFLGYIDVLLLIFIRIIFAITFIPIIVESKLPPMGRVGLCIALTVSIFGVIPPTTLDYMPTVLGFFILIVKEALVGLIMSFGVAMFFQVYNFMGHLISMQGGLGMSTFFDPTSGSQTPLIGRFYYLGFCTVFTLSGGYHWFIKALADSFLYIPVGQGVFKTDLLGAVVDGMSHFWSISFKLAAPILSILFIIDCGLGILARTVPQMNMFVIGLPLKLLILLMMMVLTMTLLPAFNDVIIEAIVDFFYNLVQGLSI